MRILCMSDLHGHLPRRLPKADLALICGDLPPMGAVSQHEYTDLQAAWVKSELAPWVAALAARMPIVAIAGNHDFLATYPWGERLLRSLDWTYLRDQSVEVLGTKIFGSPWTPRHPNYPAWAFQAEDPQLTRHWQKIPRNTDVLLVHGPPAGSLDEIAPGVHAGSASLEAWRQRTIELTGQSPLIVCGHLHEQPGYDPDTQVCACSITDEREAGPRGQVIMLDGAPGAWRVKSLKASMHPGTQWLSNLTPAEHTKCLRAERFK